RAGLLANAFSVSEANPCVIPWGVAPGWNWLTPSAFMGLIRQVCNYRCNGYQMGKRPQPPG
ncbi:MAG TPA: hypothetical protein VN643_25540, partial [Pyrinomonadaceae bacterium]|nr:hypothetical protein [Pyrinomonadaceae bacterium]